MNVQEILMTICLILTIVGVVSLNKKVKVGGTNNASLTNIEKVFTWVAGVLIPLVAVNGIMYYSLRKKYPTKAKEANKIGWITVLIGILLSILLAGL